MEASSFPVSSISTSSLSSTSSNERIAQESIDNSLRNKINSDGIKTKQSKSRNGCITCKSRRLKCDEAKPVCAQCVRRRVECGGYIKDFKWRAAFPPSREKCGRKAEVQSASPSPRIPQQAPTIQRRKEISKVKRESVQQLVGQVESVCPKGHKLSDQNSLSDIDKPIKEEDEEEEIEIPRQDLIHIPSRQREFSSSCSSDSSSLDLSFIFNQPRFASNSPEMLALNFDRNTCGILSIKDGLTENPWRTLIWPMSKSTPALYHALASLSAFHCSGQDHQMKLTGMHHAAQSISQLYKNINNMSIEQSLATSIALSLADAWDTSISTGHAHVRGGSVLISHALARTEKQKSAKVKPILRILCNAWLYTDVLSRLTSSQNDNDLGGQLWSKLDLLAGDEIDPLLGCANTLFPIIGNVANLVNVARKTEKNSITMISRANDLKQELTNWLPPSYLETPNDTYSRIQIQHSIQTAEAYRWATMLLLHQAFPEIPSLGSENLAQKVLLNLAMIPVQSGTIIVHIYPLLVASCEATSPGDRAWTIERWHSMRERMQISNIDRCIEIVKEVWLRRDRVGSGTSSESTRQDTFNGQLSDVEAIHNLPFARTIRGNENWSYIMREELGWEVMLG